MPASQRAFSFIGGVRFKNLLPLFVCFFSLIRAISHWHRHRHRVQFQTRKRNKHEKKEYIHRHLAINRERRKRRGKRERVPHSLYRQDKYKPYLVNEDTRYHTQSVCVCVCVCAWLNSDTGLEYINIFNTVKRISISIVPPTHKHPPYF